MWVTLEEDAMIRGLAGTARIPVSEFLRTLGLGYQPKSVLDAKILLDLLHTRVDLGRLGGLLKLWLTDKPGYGAVAPDVRPVLQQVDGMEAITDLVATVYQG